MNTDGLLRSLSAIYPLSENFQESLTKQLVPLSLPKHYMLVELPKISDQMYYLESGFAMSYSYADGKRQVESFWKKGDAIMLYKSFFEQTPSLESIELMEKSDLFSLSYAGLHKLFDSFMESHFLYRKIMGRYYEISRARVRELQQLNGEQRFAKLHVHYPGIEQLISQDCIASYLGITPQSLSRIKRSQSHS
jgi:CRP/FNR family transcriptional regulator, anaerobic regulatory protein